MRKIISLNIYKDHITISDNYVHSLDQNVVELNGYFRHTFEDSLDSVRLELICMIGNVLETVETFVNDNEFKVLLPNSLFEIVGVVQCKVKLYKEKEVLFIQEAFNIHVVDIVPNKTMKESFIFFVEKIKKAVLDTVEENKKEISEKVLKTVETSISEKAEQIADIALKEKKEEIGIAAQEKIKEIKEERAKHNFSLELDIDGNLYMLTEEV